MEYSADLIKTFLKVFEERSFSKAAGRLHISQSSVSTKIAQLEEQAGLTFFERSPRPLRLTEAGTVYLGFAREVANAAEELERSLSDVYGGRRGEIKIAAVDPIAAYFLPKIVSEIKETHSGLKVIISAQSLSLLWESVRKGEVDLAVVLAERPPVDLVNTLLRNERLLFVSSPRHPLARENKVTLKDLHSIPFVTGVETGGYTQMIDRMLERKGFSGYSIVARVNTFEGMKEIVRAGLGVSVLPKFTVNREIKQKRLLQVPVRGMSLSAAILLVKRRGAAETSTISTVKTLIERAALSI